MYIGPFAGLLLKEFEASGGVTSGGGGLRVGLT